jgi:hypothetical protein
MHMKDGSPAPLSITSSLCFSEENQLLLLIDLLAVTYVGSAQLKTVMPSIFTLSRHLPDLSFSLSSTSILAAAMSLFSSNPDIEIYRTKALGGLERALCMTTTDIFMENRI